MILYLYVQICHDSWMCYSGMATDGKVIFHLSYEFLLFDPSNQNFPVEYFLESI